MGIYRIVLPGADAPRTSTFPGRADYQGRGSACVRCDQTNGGEAGLESFAAFVEVLEGF